MVDIEAEGIHKLVYSSILALDVDIKGTLYDRIVLSGGNTMFNGFGSRLSKEVQTLYAESGADVGVKVICPPERKWSAWIGGSILTMMNTFIDMWITTEEYEESGPGIVMRKCF